MDGVNRRKKRNRTIKYCKKTSSIEKSVWYIFLQEKLIILLTGICDYLDRGNEDSLKFALGKENSKILKIVFLLKSII